MARPSPEIPVKTFRQIFQWPLSLQDPSSADRIFAEARNGLPEWGAPLDMAQPEKGAQYQEAVYFHDFVQDFLYPNEPIAARASLTFRRTDLIGQTLSFTLQDPISGKPFQASFLIEDLSLDLFRFGSAVITLEISLTTPTNLADALTMTDHLRRAYPGYWKDGKPGLCPHSARIADRPALSAPTREDCQAAFAERGMPKVFDWWEEIAGRQSMPINTDKSGGWRHVFDERIPLMTFISLDPAGSDRRTYEQIGEGDWYRIAAADEAGSDKMPYNTTFLRAQHDTLFYDRHSPDDMASSTTRQCFAGYHYALVGTGWFLDNIASLHFRGIYRRMNFIAQLEFATMLTFSRRVTQLVKADSPDFTSQLAEIRKDFLNFRHRFQFTDVSNHLQGREMNTHLRRAMGLPQLCADVEAELSAASDFALAQEQQSLAGSQTRLTQFATLYLPATLASSFCGMNVLAGLPDGAALISRASFAQFCAWNALAYGLAWLCLMWIEGSGTPSRDERSLKKLVGWLWALAACGAAIASPPIMTEAARALQSLF